MMGVESCSKSASRKICMSTVRSWVIEVSEFIEEYVVEINEIFRIRKTIVQKWNVIIEIQQI